MHLDIFGFEIDLRKIINSIVYLIFVFIIYLILRRVLKIMFMRADNRKISKQQKQRIKTISQIMSSLLKYAMLILVMLVILADFGVNVTSLIAGLGILTAVLGLAFQDMLKDVISGVTIIVEDQFSVGDVIEINGFKGTVINIGLKTTEVKSSNGPVKIIANHNIDGLTNYSKFATMAIVEVRTSYEVSSDKVMAALTNVKKHIARSMKLASSEVTVTPASDDLGALGVAYKVSCPCAADDCSDVQSEIREEILAEFKKSKIEIPYQHVVITEKNK